MAVDPLHWGKGFQRLVFQECRSPRNPHPNGGTVGSRDFLLSILHHRPHPGASFDGTTPCEKQILPKFDDLRRSVRIPFEQLRTKLEVGGESYQVKIANMSQEGMRIIVDSNVVIDTNQEVLIGVGAINPNVKGRVRWISPSAEDPSRVELGVEFESFLFTQPEEEDVQGLLDAWQDLSQDYSFYDSFLQILTMLDFEIVDGRISDLSEAIYGIAVWLDQRMGPLNLWQAMREEGGKITPSMIVERHPASHASLEDRKTHVIKAAGEELTVWLGGHPYFYGEDMIIEYLGGNEGQTDLLQRLVLLLAKRIKFWSKLLMKNISLQLLSEEYEPRNH